MKKNRLAVQILVTAFAVCCMGVAGAVGPVVTVFPEAMVKVTPADGRVIRTAANFPLQRGAVMEARGGPVIVRGPNFRFTARTGAGFSLDEADGKWIVTIFSGRVDYVLSANTRVKFAHGGAVYDCLAVTSARAGGKVTGSASVVGDKIVFAYTRGKLSVTGPTAGGYAITPAEVAAGAAAAGGVAAGAALGLSSGHGSVSAH